MKVHLEDVLTHFEPKSHVEESVSPLVEHDRGGFIHVDTPELILSVKL